MNAASGRLTFPSTWKVTKLKRVASLKAGNAIASEEVTPSGVYPVFGGNGIRGYTASYTHDGTFVLIGRQGALCGNVNYATGRFWASEHAVVATPISGSNVFWLGELLRSMNLNQYSQSAAQPGLSVELIGQLDVPVPPQSSQLAIASYLNRETVQSDALVAAKQRMAALLEERWQVFLETKIRALAETFGEIPLKYVCREVVVGIVVTPSAWYADSGTPAIRGTNISPGAISSSDLVYLTKEGHELHPKSRLRSDDVVVVRTGQAGAAAVVPPELDGANCIDLVIIRLLRGYSPHFLEFVLNSDWMQKHIDEHSVGTIQSHFNVGAASMVPVPRAPLADQDAIVDELRRARRHINGLVSVIERQVKLLQERRQTLTGAAVNGQLEIPGTA